MSYTALYRKFRPQNFEDVKGQDHIVTALKNQVKPTAGACPISLPGREEPVKPDGGKDPGKGSQL